MKNIKNRNIKNNNNVTKAYILYTVLGFSFGFSSISVQGKLDTIDSTNSNTPNLVTDSIMSDKTSTNKTDMQTESDEAQIFIQDLSQFDSLLNASPEQIHSYILQLHADGKLKNELALWSTDPTLFTAQPALTLGFLIDINATLDNRFEFQFSEAVMSDTLSLMNQLRASINQPVLPLTNMNNFIGTAASLHTIQNIVQAMMSDSASQNLNMDQVSQDLINLHSLLQTLDIAEINKNRTQSEEASLFILSHPKSTNDKTDYSQHFYNQIVKFANTDTATDTIEASKLEEVYNQTSHSLLMQELAIISYQVGKELGTTIDISKKAKDYKAKAITTEEQFSQAQQDMQMVQEGINLMRHWMKNIA